MSENKKTGMGKKAGSFAKSMTEGRMGVLMGQSNSPVGGNQNKRGIIGGRSRV